MTNVRRNESSRVEGKRIYQPIAWDIPKPTGDNEEPETYVVIYQKTMPTMADTIKNNTRKTYLVLSLPLPQQAVTYIVSVAGVAGSERGNYSDELTLNYSSTYADCISLPVFESALSTAVPFPPYRTWRT